MKNTGLSLRWLVGALLSLSLSNIAPAAQAAFLATVDGNLSEWGITVGDNNTSNFAGLGKIGVGSALLGGSTLYYHVEDQNDNAGASAYVGPQYGGQAYDAEFMGVVVQGSKISLAIVTGQRPSNGLSKFSPGDIRIQTSIGSFGIEVGGVPVTDTVTTVTEGDLGVTFQMNSDGSTRGAKDSGSGLYGSPTTAFAAPQFNQVAGSIWHNPVWLQNPLSPTMDVQILSVSGTPFGMADFVYTLNSQTAKHSIIELVFDFQGMGEVQSIAWSPGCGNDIVEVELPPGVHAPEPASLAVWAGLLMGVFCWRRRRAGV